VSPVRGARKAAAYDKAVIIAFVSLYALAVVSWYCVLPFVWLVRKVRA
jgi:hypothetical protein